LLERVGSDVVGNILGLFESSTVGRRDGELEGLILETTVGDIDGTTVGDIDGTTVVGVDDGVVEGSVLGIPEGAVGIEVVGENVGVRPWKNISFPFDMTPSGFTTERTKL
jgi:hypothetical protein